MAKKKTSTTKSGSTFDAPQSRNEAILQNILGANNVLGEPQSRIEALLMQILDQGGGSGGKDPLIAVYDSTSYATIAAAVAAGKMVCVDLTDGRAYYAGTVNERETAAYFTGISYDHTKIIYASVAAMPAVGSTGWSSGSVTIPETYLVTVTGQGNTYWITDRTMAQVNAAYAAGKILRAKFPITLNNDTITVEAPLVPLLSSGTPTGYMAYFTMMSGTHLYVFTFVQGGDNQADITTQDMSSDSTPAALGTASAGTSIKYARADHVHPKPSASDIGAAPAITEVTVQTSGAVTQALSANTEYWFTAATSLTLTLTAYAGTDVALYVFDFIAGSTAVSITLPNDVALAEGAGDVLAKTDTLIEVNIKKVPPFTVGNQTYNYLLMAAAAEVSAS